MKIQIFDKTRDAYVDANIIEELNPSRLLRTVKVVVDKREVGRMLYFFEKDCLNIQMIHNDWPMRYSKIGTSLVDYAFDVSLKENKEGRINVNSIPSAIKFWEKMGFQKKKNDLMYLPESTIQDKIEKHKLREAKMWADERGSKWKKF